jgi:hypothetical protein
MVRNKDLEMIAIVDKFESLIWTDRYDRAGDFQLVTLVTPEILETLQEGFYLSIKDSEHIMVIEDIAIDSDIELGNKATFTGRSIESFLGRRIIWNQTNIDGDFQDSIELLLNENAINPTITDRTMTGLVFSTSVDTRITDLTIKGQYTGEYLYDVIAGMCESKQVGFKMILNANDEFEFSLYVGEDRSYDQVEPATNPYIVFSPQFDNIIKSSYFATKATERTVTLVAGEGEGTARLTQIVNGPDGALTGYDRREIFTDARDLSRTTSGGEMTEASYLQMLVYRGILVLLENQPTTSFEGEVDATRIYIYGEDFNIGDVVQTANEYGQEGRTRVVEVIISEDTSGVNIYPTFKTVI